MGPEYGPPPNVAMRERLKAKKPENFKDVPRWLKEVVGGTFKRLIYIFKLVWEANHAILIGMALVALAEGVLPLIGTLITANLLDKVVRSFTEPVNLAVPLIWQFGWIFVQALVNSVNNMLTRISGELVTNHVKVKIMNKAKTVDIASFDMPDFYERLENANREAGMRPINIVNSTFTLISKTISMVSYVVVLAGLLGALPPAATWFFILFVALSVTSAAVSFYYRRQSFYYMRRRSRDRRELNYYSDLMVNKDMVKEIRLFDLSDVFIGRYNDIFKNYYKGVKRLIYKENLWRLILSMLSAVMNGILFYLVAHNVRKIADYSIYTGALNAISSCVTVMIANTASIYEGSLFIDNMILFMEEKQTVVPSVQKPLLPKRHQAHTIEFKNVSFRYPGTNRDVIKNINLTLEAGDTAVLVGLNGAGKTTLIKLLTRLYDPTEGEILLDGVNIKQYDVTALYKMFGIIFQDFGKYAVTVSDNIAFGQIDKTQTDEEIQRAAKASGADVFIQNLKHDYQTPLMRYFETDGVELSIGQWQKLSIARAFYSDSDILILDEPTASLDPMAEQEIFNQFDMLRKDRTTLFVSHRLSSATTANKIIVLENGQIAEIGSHKELMDKKGKYHTLFTTQAKRYIESETEEQNGDR